MGRIQSALLKEICQQSGISEKAAERLLGSVEVLSSSADDHEKHTFNLGLRLIDDEISEAAGPSKIAPLLKEYGNSCPLVTGWIARGDFNPAKPPAELTHAKILHACRTAGRLRAKFIRNR